MSYTIRGRTVAYDNIAVGAATGKEQTVAGSTGLAEIYPGGVGDSTVDVAHVTNILQGANTTDVSDEHITVGGAAPTEDALATSDHPGFTS